MNKDVKQIVEKGASTTLDITQMLLSYAKYLRDRDEESKKKFIRYSIVAGVGILSLITVGVLGLMESRKKDDSVLYYS